MENQTYDYVLIKDENNFTRAWMVEQENSSSYNIFYMGYTTEIRKEECYEKNGKLYSDKIIATKYNNGNIGISDFSYIHLES
jgi:hypothetical protein